MDDQGDFNPFTWAKTPQAKIIGPTFPGQLQIVAFGGGTDSTAVLIGLRDRGLKPDKITFADTGGERQEVYDHVYIMNTWARKNFGVDIEIVKARRRDKQTHTLEEYALRTKMLPSIAYGGKSCSIKFKIEPQRLLVNHWPEAKAAFKRRERVLKYIGFDAGEVRRVRPQATKDGKYWEQYPLIAWGWFRGNCLETIRKEGLSLPGKSSCFFCPNLKPAEILALPQKMKDRAIQIERTATERREKNMAAYNLRMDALKKRARANYAKDGNMRKLQKWLLKKTGEQRYPTVGLARKWKWEDIINKKCEVDQAYLPSIPCDCIDGE